MTRLDEIKAHYTPERLTDALGCGDHFNISAEHLAYLIRVAEAAEEMREQLQVAKDLFEDSDECYDPETDAFAWRYHAGDALTAYQRAIDGDSRE